MFDRARELNVKCPIIRIDSRCGLIRIQISNGTRQALEDSIDDRKNRNLVRMTPQNPQLLFLYTHFLPALCYAPCQVLIAAIALDVVKV